MLYKFTQEQLEIAIKLQRKGKTQTEIASQLGVERETVCRNLARHNRRVAARMVKRSVDEKGKQLQRLEFIYAQSVNGWQRSKRDAESRKTMGGGESERTETTIKGQAGDPAMLAKAMDALTDMRSILGLDAPKATDVTSGGKPITGIPITVIEVVVPGDAQAK